MGLSEMGDFELLSPFCVLGGRGIDQTARSQK